MIGVVYLVGVILSFVIHSAGVALTIEEGEDIDGPLPIAFRIMLLSLLWPAAVALIAGTAALFLLSLPFRLFVYLRRFRSKKT